MDNIAQTTGANDAAAEAMRPTCSPPFEVLPSPPGYQLWVFCGMPEPSNRPSPML